MIGQQLKRVRLARGLSLDELSIRLGGLVTKQALSKYERGEINPSASVLIKLSSVLNVRTSDLLQEPSTNTEFIAYRKRSRLTTTQSESIKNSLSLQMQQRIHIGYKLGITGNPILPIQNLPVHSLEETEIAANRLRGQWNLGIDPIANLTSVLEDQSIHVIGLDIKKNFDGIAAIEKDQQSNPIAACIGIQRNVPGERQRLSLAHELGHIVMRVDQGLDEEKAAFRFGAAFLAPKEVVFRRIGNHRTSITTDELLLHKKYFGMSLQAILYRLKDLDIINQAYFRGWMIKINRQKWKNNEPSPIDYETPTWLQQNVLRALSEGVISSEEVKTMIKLNQITPSFELAEPRVRDILKLSINQRHQLLSAQADQAYESYSHPDEERDIWQGGDFLDEY